MKMEVLCRNFNSQCNFIFNVYLFLRETEHKQGRGRERGRHRIGSRLQALSKLSAQSLTWGPNPRSVRS